MNDDNIIQFPTKDDRDREILGEFVFAVQTMFTHEYENLFRTSVARDMALLLMYNILFTSQVQGTIALDMNDNNVKLVMPTEFADMLEEYMKDLANADKEGILLN